MKTCPCCGAGIPEVDVLSPLQRKIVEIVRTAPGLQGPQLFSRVYADDINGGPERINTIQVHIANINKKLKPQGLCIRTNSKGSRAGYSLRKLEEE